MIFKITAIENDFLCADFKKSKSSKLEKTSQLTERKRERNTVSIIRRRQEKLGKLKKGNTSRSKPKVNN